ncbi:hypothetical protein OS493_007101 [Desmophyllum pertusum]|uniref:Uncharacterized protein n=1 Tax=Desmophyllum pertusum TaxID=174260 RepID=A0A9X0D020_9CNID|nr:hypothetical protein OS493_007101 [Desmophyllum pertusum]
MGPNGDGEIVVPVIKTCGCVSPGCHRVVFREVFKRKTKERWIQETNHVLMRITCCDNCRKRMLGCVLEPAAQETKLCDSYCMIYRNGACIATNYTTEAVYTGDLKCKEIHFIK